MMRIVVVLPAPLGPMNPKMLPEPKEKLTWSAAVTGPKIRVTFSTFTSIFHSWTHSP